MFQKSRIIFFIFLLAASSFCFAEDSEDSQQEVQAKPESEASDAAGQEERVEESDKEEVAKAQEDAPHVNESEVENAGTAKMQCMGQSKGQLTSRIQELGYSYYQQASNRDCGASGSSRADALCNIAERLKSAQACLDGVSGCKDKNLQGTRVSQQGKSHACDHIVMIEEHIGPQMAKAQALVDEGNQWIPGAAEDVVNMKSGLIDITKGFLGEHDINKGRLERCDSKVQTSIKESLLSKVESKRYRFAHADSVNRCINSSKGIFEAGDVNDEGLYISFLRDYQQNVKLNMRTLCKDHAQNYCQPAYAFLYLCKQLGPNIKGQCEEKAKSAIDLCVRGNYSKAMLPREAYEHTMGTYQAENGLSAYFSSGEQEPSKQLKPLTTLASETSGVNYYEDFGRMFHEMYGSCVVLRRAAEKMAKGDSVIKVPEKVEPLQGKANCNRKSAWTVDFNYCATKIQYADGLFDIASAGAQTGIGIKSALDESEIQKDLRRDTASGDPTASIEASEKRLDNAAENSYLQASVAGAHATGLGEAAINFPTPKKLSTACSQPFGTSHYGDAVLNCGMAWVIDTFGGDMLEKTFANQKVRGAFAEKAAVKMGQSLFHAISGSQKKGQANDLDKIKRKYDDFFSQKPTGPEYVGVDYCKQNPSAPSCKGSGGRKSTSKLQTSFGGAGLQGQGGGNFSFNKIKDGFETEEELSEEERKARDRLGDIIGNGGGRKFEDDFSVPGAAKGKVGRGAGKGGAGGSAGGAGGAGGSTAAAPKKDRGGPRQQGMTKDSPDYKSGSGVAWKPGNSARGKKKDRNAFQDMFGRKKRDRGVATVIEGVAPASSKLFEKISKAYGKATQDKRLYNISDE